MFSIDTDIEARFGDSRLDAAVLSARLLPQLPGSNGHPLPKGKGYRRSLRSSPDMSFGERQLYLPE